MSINFYIFICKFMLYYYKDYYKKESLILNKMLFSRSQICNLFNIKLDTLRHYENLDLIKPIIKENNYKYYSIENIEILNVILTFRSFNMSLSNITEIINCDDLIVYKSHLKDQLSTIEKQIKNLEEAKNDIISLKNYIAEYETLKGNLIKEKDLKINVKLSRLLEENFVKDLNKVNKINVNTKKTSSISFLTIKFVDSIWLNTNREDISNCLQGFICKENYDKEFIIENALSFYTFEEMSNIPQIITNIKEKNKSNYNFSNYMLIIEINSFRCFNQGKLIRKIILPYT